MCELKYKLATCWSFYTGRWDQKYNYDVSNTKYNIFRKWQLKFYSIHLEQYCGYEIDKLHSGVNWKEQKENTMNESAKVWNV